MQRHKSIMSKAHLAMIIMLYIVCDWLYIAVLLYRYIQATYVQWRPVGSDRSGWPSDQSSSVGFRVQDYKSIMTVSFDSRHNG